MNASATVLQGQMVYSLESASIVPPVTLYAGKVMITVYCVSMSFKEYCLSQL